MAARPDGAGLATLPRRIPPLALAGGLVLVHLAVAGWVFDPTPFTGGDNAGYVVLARSLLQLHAYRDLYDPALPVHTQYPPVFPLIIAGASLVGIRSWVQLKVLTIGFSALAVGFTYLFLRRRGRPWVAVAAALLVALAPGVLRLSHLELSDVPFWFFTMLALWGWQRLPRRGGGRLALAIAATLLAYFTRSAGLPLAVASLAWLAYRRRWRQLAALAAVILPLAFLWWLRAHLHHGVDYARYFLYVDPYDPARGLIGPLDLVKRVGDNGKAYIGTQLPMLLFSQTGGLFLGVSTGIAVFAFVGWLRRLRRPAVAEAFFPLYVGLVFIWPSVWAGERFLLPVLPLLLAYTGEALVAGIGRLGRSAAAPVAAAATALVVVVMVPPLAQAAQNGRYCTAAYRDGRPMACLPAQWQGFFEMGDWSRTHLPPGAVVLSRKPRLFYVYSGHRGRTLPFTRDPGEFLARAREAGARYVVFDETDAIATTYLLPVVQQQPGWFCLLQGFGAETGAILGILAGPQRSPPPSPGAGASLEACPAGYASGAGGTP